MVAKVKEAEVARATPFSIAILTLCIVNSFPSPDGLLVALIMLTSEKSYSYPRVSYIHIAIMVSAGTDLDKHVDTS